MIKAEDQNIFNEFIQDECCGSELCFANIFAWKDDDELRMYHDEHLLVIKGRNFFFPPLVRNVPYQQGIDFIQEYCKNHAFPFTIFGVTQKFLPYFQLPNTQLIRHPELDEYLYQANDLITYSGKKFHAKRNLFNQFLKIPHEFVPYNPLLRNQIITLVKLWSYDVEDTHELEGILALLDDIDTIHCFCECIIINGHCQAFAIGTVLNEIGIVLFEKANIDYPGIYAAIVQMVAKKHFQQVKYINRQEDMGIENLKKSKMSYNPIGFIEKWQCTYDTETQAKHLYALSFHDSPDYISYFFTNKRHDAHYLEENNTLQSMLYSRKQTIHWQNSDYPSRLVFTLATHPHFRHLGKMHQLVKKTLQDWSIDTVFVTLHPAIIGFYEPLGFAYIDTMPIIPPNVLREETTSQDYIQSIYQDYLLKCDCYHVRTEKDWIELFYELQLNGGSINLLKKEHEVVGYALHDTEEFIEIIMQEPITNLPNNMIRILNVSLLLALAPFVPDKTIQIIDDLIPINEITIEGKSPEVQVMTISEFTVYFFEGKQCFLPDRY
ncbi:MAG: GNAT family N-acetyltransferase [Bacilli bacterium]|nr:GNAT family N-acetyltransferase [Bacilli bacterium]